MRKRTGYLLIFAAICIAGVIGWKYFHKSENAEYLPPTPDYTDSQLWYTVSNDSAGTGGDIFYIVSTWEKEWLTDDNRLCRYADAYNTTHQSRMALEIKKIADYMAEGNNFCSPYYRHVAIETWATQNEDTIARRTQMPMQDICRAFDYFNSNRDKSRPFVIAGFSQGGKAVVELLKHMDDTTYEHLAAAYVLGYKVTPADTAATRHIRAAHDAYDTGVTICYNTVKDVKYVNTVISKDCVMGINPVNWRTDATPALLHDSITVTLDTLTHVLVVNGYEGNEYHPILGFINVGDIHSCEPWLYSECLKKNIATRISEWYRKDKNNTH